MEVVGRAGLELGHEMQVEVSSRFGLGVNKQTPASDVIGQFDESREDVLEEPGSQPLSFMVDIDAESCEKRYRLWVAAWRGGCHVRLRSISVGFGEVCWQDLGVRCATEGKECL